MYNCIILYTHILNSCCISSVPVYYIDVLIKCANYSIYKRKNETTAIHYIFSSLYAILKLYALVYKPSMLFNGY